MLGTLIESRAARQRRTGSSLASIVIHAALIGGAVGATMETGDAAPPEKRVPTIVVFQPPPKLPEPMPVATNPLKTATSAVAPKALVLRVPTIVPTEIPPIDLSAAPTPPDFDTKRIVGTPGLLLCDRDCPRSGSNVGADGRDTWTPNDVMMRLRETPAPPRYPESLRRAGIEGDVVVKFIVDTTGRVEMASVEVLRSTHDAFVAAVRESLAKLRFDPSRVGERKVTAVAMMPFHFTLK